MADMFGSIWEMMDIIGFTVNDIYVSLRDILVVSILGSLFVYLLVQMLGGND